MTNSQTKESKMKAKTYTSTWTCAYPYELRRTGKWSFNNAEEYVWYELWEVYTGWRGKVKYRPVTGWRDPDGNKHTATGDIKWAEKTAKRFNLKVPKV
jgi:hypothetical protein